MSVYGAVTNIASRFDAVQWNPATHTPSTATVTEWLTYLSTVLDGEIGHVVSVPVSGTTSPNLYAVCGLVCELRAAAQVCELLRPDEPGQLQAKTWRGEANDLVKRIAAGATADGVALGGRSPEAAGSPAGDFGTATFTTGQKF